MKSRKPRPTETGTPVLVRLQPELLSLVDQFIRETDASMSRPEAIRRLLAERLEAKD